MSKAQTRAPEADIPIATRYNSIELTHNAIELASGEVKNDGRFSLRQFLGKNGSLCYVFCMDRMKARFAELPMGPKRGRESRNMTPRKRYIASRPETREFFYLNRL
jgi:hypothetical protein